MFVAPTFADRLPWSAVDGAVRAAIEQFLGSPVVEASGRVGGFSPGFAGVVTAADGRSVFVKAISTEQNPTTPAMLRTEREIARALRNPNVPRLLTAIEVGPDSGDWVALVFEAVPGESPPLPWTRRDAVDVLVALRGLSASLTPSPVFVRPFTEHLAEMVPDWDRACAAGSPVLTGWVGRRVGDLAGLARTAAEPDGPLAGDTLLHNDLRADNLLVDRSGPRPHVWFVDWPWASVGPAWIDAVVLALDFAAFGGLVPESVLDEAGVTCPSDALACLLAAFAGNWAEALNRPAPPRMTGLRPFQRRFFDATVAWLQRLV